MNTVHGHSNPAGSNEFILLIHHKSDFSYHYSSTFRWAGMNFSSSLVFSDAKQMNCKPFTRIRPVIAVCKSLLFCKLTETRTTVFIGIFGVNSFTSSQVKRLVSDRHAGVASADQMHFDPVLGAVV